MTTEQLYAAGMTKELPDIPEDLHPACNPDMDELDSWVGNNERWLACDVEYFKAPSDDREEAQRRFADLIVAAHEAIKLHKALKAELEHHWRHYSKLDPAKSRSYDRRKRSHAAAIRRIAGYLGVE